LFIRIPLVDHDRNPPQGRSTRGPVVGVHNNSGVLATIQRYEISGGGTHYDTSLAYTSGDLTTITDAGGSVVTLAYNGDHKHASYQHGVVSQSYTYASGGIATVMNGSYTGTDVVPKLTSLAPELTASGSA
jgi:hypothetical protein